MTTLLPEELESRRLGDAADLLEIDKGPFPISIRGYHSAGDAIANVNEVCLDDQVDPPTVFTVTCEFASLDEQKRPLRGVKFLVNPNAGGDYPETEPVAQVISKPVPFAPHIGFPSGAVCHGHDVWKPLRSPLWLYVSQLCRIANWDEPYDEHVTVMNYAALQHWVTLGRRPLDPNLGSPSASGGDASQRVMRRTGVLPSGGRSLRRAANPAPAPRSLKRVS